MYRIILLMLCTLIHACSSGSSGGGGSGDGGGKPEPQPPTGEFFNLGGVASGISGQLILSNGVDDDFVILGGNGPFVFPQALPSGELYDVKIEAKPEDHFCEIANSRNFLIRDTNNVIVRCARSVLREIVFTRPASFALERLNLASNYQTIGAGTNTVLQDSGNHLQVFDHSVVALTFADLESGEPKPILLAHIHDMREYLQTPENLRAPVTLDADSTIEALLLLEPTLTSALLERVRYLPEIEDFNELSERLFAHLRDSQVYRTMAEQLRAHLAAQLTLTEFDEPLAESLQALLLAASRVLTDTAELKLNPPSLPETVSGTAVDLAPVELGSAEAKIALANNGSRAVALSSQRFATSWLGSFKSRYLLLESPVGAQDSLTLTINGPGSFGQVSAATKPAFDRAVVQSGLENHFFKSMSILLGLQQPTDFNLYDCLDMATLDGLEAELANAVAPDLGVSDFDYANQYARTFAALRSKLISSTSSEITLNGLLSCDKFGAGSYLDTQRDLSVKQVRLLLTLAQGLYPAEKPAADLFEFANLTNLTHAIQKTRVEAEWLYSNRLVVDLIADRLVASPDQDVQFQAECLDPGDDNTTVPCSIAWQFGDGFKVPAETFETGLSQQTHRFANAGEYQVTVDASRSEGVAVSQSTLINIVAPKARLTVRKPNGLAVSAAGLLHDFGNVLVGSEQTVQMQIENSGSAPLTIFDLRVDDAGFAIGAYETSPIAAGESVMVSVSFAPVAARAHDATIEISTDDDLYQDGLFAFRVAGRGFLPGEPAEGAWLIDRDGVSEQYTVARARVDHISGGGLSVRVFGNTSSVFPQILFTLGEVPVGETVRLTLDDDASGSCKGAVILADAQDTYCTITSDAVSQPVTGFVDVTRDGDGGGVLHFEFDAALNALTCGTVDVTQCEVISVRGDLLIDQLPL